MRKSILMLSLTVLFTVIFVMPVKASLHDEPDEVIGTIGYNAASALVMDAATGVVLYETEGFSRRYPASITKVMTALVVLEQIEDLDERIIFSEEAVYIPWYASRMGVYEGETMSVREALFAIMLPSANEVARALAEHVSGSVPAFVDAMNLRAESLGAYNTRFINPCGLPGYHQFTTAYDVALIMQAAIAHPILLHTMSTPYFHLPPMEIHNEWRLMRNTNLMIRPHEPEFDPRVIGGKTGFTRAAGHVLVTYAEYDGFELIVVVLYAEARNYIFSDTAALLDFAFANFEPVQPFVEEPEEPEVVPVFVPVPDYEYEYEEEEESTPGFFGNIDTPAAIAATMSFVLVGAAFLGLWKLYKYYERRDGRHG